MDRFDSRPSAEIFDFGAHQGHLIARQIKLGSWSSGHRQLEALHATAPACGKGRGRCRAVPHSARPDRFTPSFGRRNCPRHQCGRAGLAGRSTGTRGTCLGQVRTQARSVPLRSSHSPEDIVGPIARFAVEQKVETVLVPTHFLADPNFDNWRWSMVRVASRCARSNAHTE